MATALTQTVAPTANPVTYAEAKAHLRLDSDDEREFVEGCIGAAVGLSETMSNRQFMTATYTLKLDLFPAGGGVVLLPRPPLQSVSSISYIDVNGDSQTWASANYTVDTDSIRGRITEAYGMSWPSTRAQTGAITVTFVAGYATAALVPSAAKHAINMLVGHYYVNREAVSSGRAMSVPMAADSLLASVSVPEAY